MVLNNLHEQGYVGSVQSLFHYSADSGLGIEAFRHDYLPGTSFPGHTTMTLYSKGQLKAVLKELLSTVRERLQSTLCQEDVDCYFHVDKQTSCFQRLSNVSKTSPALHGEDPFNIYSTIILADGVDFRDQGPNSAYRTLSTLMSKWAVPITSLIIMPKVLDTAFAFPKMPRNEVEAHSDINSPNLGTVLECMLWFEPQNLCLSLGDAAQSCCPVGASVKMLSDAACVIGGSDHCTNPTESATAVLHGTHGGMLYVNWEAEPFSGQMTYQVHIELLKKASASTNMVDSNCLTRCWGCFAHVQYLCNEPSLDVIVFGASGEEFDQLNTGAHCDYEIDGEIYPSEYITLKRAITAPAICRACSKPWFES